MHFLGLILFCFPAGLALGTVQKYLELSVQSSRRFASVSLDGEQIVAFNTPRSELLTEYEDNSTALHFIVLNQHNGGVLKKRQFRTTSHPESMAVHPFLDSIEDGRIVILFIKYEASLNLPKVTRNALQSFGATGLQMLEYNNYYCAVLVRGFKTYAEAIVVDNIAPTTGSFGSPVNIHLSIPLMDEGNCWGSRQSVLFSFCSKYSGYGELCACGTTSGPTFYPPTIDDFQLYDTVLMVIAGNRPSDLYRCLLTILSQPGSTQIPLVVSVNGKHKEVEDLLHILKIDYFVNVEEEAIARRNSTSFRISKHYIFSLENTFNKFSEADKVIVIEEDLLLSPDFISYFNQTSWLLDSDPSLFCISAWNDLGALHGSRDRSKLLRIETHQGYGWMMKRSLFEDLVDDWKAIENDHDWDVWFRSPHIRAGRESLIPDVSRSFHYGLTGVHVNGVLTLAHFAGHLMSATETPVVFDTHRMLQSTYEEHIMSTLESEETYYLNSTSHPCSTNFIPENFTAGPLVVFFEMLTAEDYTAWVRIGGCTGMWEMDARCHHRGLFHYKYYNTSVYAIGYPFSDYSFLLPPKVHVIRALQDLQEKRTMSEMVLKNRQRFKVKDLEPFVPSLLKADNKPRPVFVVVNNNITNYIQEKNNVI